MLKRLLSYRKTCSCSREGPFHEQWRLEPGRDTCTAEASGPLQKIDNFWRTYYKQIIAFASNTEHRKKLLKYSHYIRANPKRRQKLVENNIITTENITTQNPLFCVSIYWGEIQSFLVIERTLSLFCQSLSTLLLATAFQSRSKHYCVRV